MDTDDLTTQISELTAELASLKTSEQTRTQRTQSISEQLQQRLQQTANNVVHIRGQIVELNNTLSEQERDRYRLEGALDAIKTSTEG